MRVDLREGMFVYFVVCIIDILRKLFLSRSRCFKLILPPSIDYNAKLLKLVHSRTTFINRFMTKSMTYSNRRMPNTLSEVFIKGESEFSLKFHMKLKG